MNPILEMEKQVESLKSVIESVHWQDNAVYAEWLSQQRYIVERSVPYLGLCMFHAHDFPDFQKRCRNHIGEEADHEVLLDKDLQKIGKSMTPELPETMLVHRTQYFQVSTQGALSFLGYIFFLEMLAPAFGPYVIKQRKGEATGFLNVHANEDEDHLSSAAQIFEKVDQKTREAILQNFKMSAASYTAMLEKIALMSKSKVLAA